MASEGRDGHVEALAGAIGPTLAAERPIDAPASGVNGWTPKGSTT